MKTYIYKGKLYELVCEAQIKLNGVWEECVIYRTLYYNPDGTTWVRKKDEFYNLFKEFTPVKY